PSPPTPGHGVRRRLVRANDSLSSRYGRAGSHTTVRPTRSCAPRWSFILELSACNMRHKTLLNLQKTVDLVSFECRFVHFLHDSAFTLHRRGRRNAPQIQPHAAA